MHAARTAANSDIAAAHDGERAQPVFVLMARELAASMTTFLDAGERKIDRWFESHSLAYADFSDVAASLVNVNRLEDIAALDPPPPS